MNAERLLAHFEQIADAPDAIARLRRFILDLAGRGKLVPQDANDEPASELLKRIAKERARLVRAGEVRKSEVDPVIEESAPFSVPSKWTWTRLGSIADWGSGSTPPRGNSDFYGGGIPWLKSGELNDNRALAGSEETVTQLAIDKGSFRLNKPGDVLLAMYGATIGKVAILAARAVTNQAVCGCTPFAGVFNQFLFLFLLSQREQFHLASEGGAQPNISKVKIVWTPFPLPPFAEQHRIVAKVDELMGLCERLQAARAGREARRDRLTAASLARLDAPDPETFQADARFALHALPALTTRPDQIKQLRQTILNLAVHGKLVPQDPNDEPTRELLGRFAARKAKGRKGRDWSQGTSSQRSPPFEPPSGWSWTTIDETAQRVTVGYVGPMRDQYVENGVPFLRSQNVRANIFREEGLIHISPAFHQKIIKSALVPGDVVVVRSGNVGTACVIPSTVKEANCSDLVVVQKPECVLPEFLCFYLNSLAAAHIEAGSVGVALTHFNTKSVATMPLPLPPLAEQQRIVAKVDALLALCDGLEASLAATANSRCRLLDALLVEALTPSHFQERAAAE
jgi:type I restriction enzyme, S subunit